MENELSQKILSQNFEPVRNGFIGGKPTYSKTEVDAFLQEASDLAEELETEKDKLAKEVGSLRNQTEMMSGDADQEELVKREKEVTDKEKRVDKMERSFHRMIIMAESQSDEIKEKAQQEAKKIIQKAQEEAETVTEESKKRAEQLIIEARRRKDEAQTQADEMVTEAENKANEVVSEAQDKVKLLEERSEMVISELGKLHRVLGKTLSVEEGMGSKAFSNESGHQEAQQKAVER